MSLREKTALCLCLLFAFAYPDEGCDKSQCKGPIKYYEELNCKPVYANAGDCCAVRYDCSHLNSRSADKCYANGHEYSIGDQLKKEDRASSCDMECTCRNGYDDIATFTCAFVDCFNPPPEKDCYWKLKPNECCPDEVVCPKEGEETVTCEVEGQTYRDGEPFYPKEKPLLYCLCMEGFKGELVEPFCKKVSCGTDLRQSAYTFKKCTPIYYETQSLVTSCSVSTRCQNINDTVIDGGATKSSGETSAENKSDKSDSDEQASDMKCTFGNLTMKVGDELKQATDYNSVCVKCVCEVPPTPTCRQLDSECDIRNKPPFALF